MPKNFILSLNARIDLKQILRHIGQDNINAAERMRVMFDDAFAMLGERPLMGQERDDITSQPLRFWPVHRNYMIVYDPATNPVMIVRIYHSARFTAMLVPQ